MTQRNITNKLTSAIPTIVCILAIALSLWVIAATEAKAQTVATPTHCAPVR